jgi:predicted nucleotide-binding protein
MDYDPRYQEGKNGALTKGVRDRIAAFRVRGSTLSDIAEALGFSASFVSQLLNDVRPARVRTIRVPRIIEVLEKAEQDVSAKGADGPQSPETEHTRDDRDLPPSNRVAPKPAMFIASSSESKHVAGNLQEELESDVEATVWSQGVFALSRTFLDSLVRKLEESDFATFVLAPDDVTRIRSESKGTVRDNVIFELGLAIGHLGVERCFLVKPRDAEDLHLPSDLTGITAAEYNARRPDNNLLAALGPAANRIRREVVRLGIRNSRGSGR